MLSPGGKGKNTKDQNNGYDQDGKYLNKKINSRVTDGEPHSGQDNDDDKGDEDVKCSEKNRQDTNVSSEKLTGN